MLEGFFWKILHKGIIGKSTAVNYGVDVETEGEFKGVALAVPFYMRLAELHVEWYCMDDTGRLVEKEKRPIPGGKKEASKAEATVTSAQDKTEDTIDDDERKRWNI